MVRNKKGGGRALIGIQCAVVVRSEAMGDSMEGAGAPGSMRGERGNGRDGVAVLLALELALLHLPRVLLVFRLHRGHDLQLLSDELLRPGPADQASAPSVESSTQK